MLYNIVTYLLTRSVQVSCPSTEGSCNKRMVRYGTTVNVASFACPCPYSYYKDISFPS